MGAHPVRHEQRRTRLAAATVLAMAGIVGTNVAFLDGRLTAETRSAEHAVIGIAPERWQAVVVSGPAGAGTARTPAKVAGPTVAVSILDTAAVSGATEAAAIGPSALGSVTSEAESKPRSSGSSSGTTSSASTSSGSGSGGSSSGWAWPIKGQITQYFGGDHRGIDILADYGDTVRSAHAGRVTEVGYLSSCGGLEIRMDIGGGMDTRYMHLSAESVSVGDSIALGEVIGRVGESGCATGPHLHLGVRVNEVYVDPLRYLP
jgi:murein DD-endopeptidase MepM/ murein hydrolase activator NlpD